ncbi:hypothetical protein M405DRAFT_921557, partial [Rhizopogon salebrosus TDB-379]
MRRQKVQGHTNELRPRRLISRGLRRTKNAVWQAAVAKNASCGRGCGHSGKIVIFHLLIAAVLGRINGWFNEDGVLVLAGACTHGHCRVQSSRQHSSRNTMSVSAALATGHCDHS